MAITQVCLVLHANGLCKEVWAPFVEELARFLRVDAVKSELCLDFPEALALRLGSRLLLLVDLLGHGAAPSLKLEGAQTDWMQFARRLDAILTSCRNAIDEDVEFVAVGHSMGGGAALMLQATSISNRFSRMVLHEPMYLFVEPRIRSLIGATEDLLGMQSPLALQALKRKAEWKTREEAEASLQRKPFFAAWHPLALKGYFSQGLLTEDSGITRLACSPSTEANLFSSHAPSELLRCLECSNGLKGCRLHISIGNRPLEWNHEVASALFGALRPRAEISTADGTHMWPVEQPRDFASFVANALGWSSQRAQGDEEDLVRDMWHAVSAYGRL